MTPDTLGTVLQHEQQQRDQAQAAWRSAADGQHAAEQRAQQLQTYRTEYQAHWSGQFRKSGGIELLQCYQGFVQRLDEAIAQQLGLLRHAQAHQQHTAAVLAQAAQRVAAVEKLIARRQQAHQVQQQRKDQRTSDDAAQRRRSHPPRPENLA